VYNNGTHENFDHGVYAASEGGEKQIVDNIVFDNLAYGSTCTPAAAIPFSATSTCAAIPPSTPGDLARWTAERQPAHRRDVLTEHMSADSNLLYFPAHGRNCAWGCRARQRDIWCGVTTSSGAP